MVLASAALLVSSARPVRAQNPKFDSQQRQLLLSASSTMTLLTELEKAGAAGFHTVMGTTRGSGEVVLLLERTLPETGKPPEKVQYRLIATNATGTFLKEISAAASQGFRAAPGTFLNKPSGLTPEIVVVMEKTEGSTKRYEYKVISTNQTSTAESEWIVSTTQGYKQVGMLTRSEVMILMERPAK
jgi:hypothetical protein